jgi:hypothetical protein
VNNREEGKIGGLATNFSLLKIKIEVVELVET